MHFLAIVVALSMRHLPQLLIDLRHRDRVPTATRPTPVRGAYVTLLYGAICAPSLLGLAEGAQAAVTAGALGVGAFGLGWALGLAGLLAIRQYYTEDISICPGFKLVRTGVYGLVRHPIRLGLALEALGLILMTELYVLLPVWLAMVALQLIRSRQEDDFLRQQLGDDAVQYQRYVPAVNLPLGTWRRLRQVMTNWTARGTGARTRGDSAGAPKQRLPV